MSEDKYFITGAMGCLGAWVVRNLIRSGIKTVAFDQSANRQRLELVMTPEELMQVDFVLGDITDTETVKASVIDHQITHIIHLAALQVPFCKADPPKGAAVNVVGTVNIFEAAKAASIKKLVYASSIAVYGGRDEYPGELLTHLDLTHPHTHYGVFKQANEGTARIYWQDDGLASIGLRPYTLYGPGRDQGMTSTPTQAMLAAARHESYHISYGGYNGFQYNDDIARIFIRAAQIPFSGAQVFNIQGSIAHMEEVVAAIEAAEPTAKGKITFEHAGLNFPNGQEDQLLRELLGEIPNTPLQTGVAQTIALFKQAIAQGLLAEKSEEYEVMNQENK
jgi:nucleoside-diphosphate-sugar epimerase